MCHGPIVNLFSQFTSLRIICAHCPSSARVRRTLQTEISRKQSKSRTLGKSLKNREGPGMYHTRYPVATLGADDLQESCRCFGNRIGVLCLVYVSIFLTGFHKAEHAYYLPSCPCGYISLLMHSQTVSKTVYHGRSALEPQRRCFDIV